VQQFKVKRSKRTDLVFNGELLVRIDDKQWVNSGATWWELSLYKTDKGAYVLGSAFHVDYPMRGKYYGAKSFGKPQEVIDFVLTECRGPQEIAETLIKKAAMRDKGMAFSKTLRERLSRRAPTGIDYCPTGMSAA
jgi:hypothetical protein